MKMVFNFSRAGWACLAGLLLLGGCARRTTSGPSSAAPASATEPVRRLAAILDYVAADYPAAARGKGPEAALELEEQRVFLRDAQALGRTLPGPPHAPTLRELARIAALVDAHAAPDEVAAACRRLRQQLLERHGVVIAPLVPPSRERAGMLYQKACASCHGSTGAGDGTAAAGLRPPPRSFRDPAVVAELSPARAYNALSDGISGTAMPSFGTLPTSDRWSLAFYVLSLQHTDEAAARGRARYEALPERPTATPTRLAGVTDRELEEALRPGVPDPAARRDLLAFLRTVAPYEQSGAPLDPARRLLTQAVGELQEGRREAARHLLRAAYLDAFEPHEGALRAHDATLLARTEERFLSLRQRIVGGAPAEEVESEALQLGVLLDQADEILSGRRGGRVAFVGALLVVLREGIEAALLLMVLFGLVRGETARGDARALHLGWASAAMGGALLWFVSGRLLHTGGASRELVEGILSLVTAAVLLLAGHYILARLDARRRIGAFKREVAAADPRKRHLVLFGLAFVAIGREAFEVVLFLRTLLLDARAATLAVAAGAASGAAACVLVVATGSRLRHRLPAGRMLTVAGSLLCALAAVLAGKGIRSLQAVGLVGITPLPLPRIEWLGFYPTLQGVAAQAAVVAAFVTITLLTTARAKLSANQPPLPAESNAKAG